MHIQAKTLDDLLREALTKLYKAGKAVNPPPTKGGNRELFGVMLELTNPLARLSCTETKGKIFSCLGELLWYLSKSNKLDFIEHYIPVYPNFSDDGETLYGAYGPRIFGEDPYNQYTALKEKLSHSTSSRKAVIQIISSKDITEKTKDVPCTCTLQFVNRDGYLHMLAQMRSNDVMKGLPHDIFAFTMLQEILARDLNVKLGNYKHSVGSLHLYEKDFSNAQRYLAEGWQDSFSMPPMPQGSPWKSIEAVLGAEEQIRTTGFVDLAAFRLEDYWLDIIRLLMVYQASKEGNYKKIVEIKKGMTVRIYEEYIRQKEKPSGTQIVMPV
jgi:thymidylate synthase